MCSINQAEAKLRRNIYMEKVTDYFGCNVFGDSAMKERLPKKTYDAFKKMVDNGEELDPQVAEAVANAMKDWAIEHGATHYTHWFQPMTGYTAEKQDSFITPAPEGKALMDFSGKELIKGEPDASSFPSGGLRNTFEARGYTTWDTTSPAFLKDDGAGPILYIPTAFCSYTGEVLDKKTPLLRSMEAISNQAVRVLRLLGDKTVKKVDCSIGPEQEYFIISKDNYAKREDLVFTGRTLFGAMPPKGEEMDDHYLGTIPERIQKFMKEVNEELWKLGVYAKTQHNEVAPGQHEIAVIFETANIATDHNQLVMDILKRVAEHHDLECLLAEKPFAGLSGSGKHDNWSLVTDYGKNLLNPGKRPHENLQFLLFLSAVIRAVDLHSPLLRLSAAVPGNDHRLGANEAPPAIISVFLGEQLNDILEQISEKGAATSSLEASWLKVGAAALPALKRDTTDRNRTSPFAFTGNKFEFRMLGSSSSIAGANTILNTIVAESLSDFADELEQASSEAANGIERAAIIEKTVLNIVKKNYEDHKRIIFDGNAYSEEWKAEAAKRGLPNVKTMVDAIPYRVEKDTVEMFKKFGVYTEIELNSRVTIDYDNYCKAIGIEAKTMIEMVEKLYVPAIIKATKRLADDINAIRLAVPEARVTVQTKMLTEMSDLLAETYRRFESLRDLQAQALTIEKGPKRANFYKDSVCPEMEALRKPIDRLEIMVGKESWPVPSYADMLYEVSY
jgi:glutamine synthetase